jgi:hypothetical protein
MAGSPAKVRVTGAATIRLPPLRVYALKAGGFPHAAAGLSTILHR